MSRGYSRPPAVLRTTRTAARGFGIQGSPSWLALCRSPVRGDEPASLAVARRRRAFPPVGRRSLRFNSALKTPVQLPASSQRQSRCQRKSRPKRAPGDTPGPLRSSMFRTASRADLASTREPRVRSFQPAFAPLAASCGSRSLWSRRCSGSNPLGGFIDKKTAQMGGLFV